MRPSQPRPKPGTASACAEYTETKPLPTRRARAPRPPGRTAGRLLFVRTNAAADLALFLAARRGQATCSTSPERAGQSHLPALRWGGGNVTCPPSPGGRGEVGVRAKRRTRGEGASPRA